MEAGKSLHFKVFLLYAVLCSVGVLIVLRVVQIQYVQGDKWVMQEKEFTQSYDTIEAARGDIYSNDGNLLATSIPYYDVAMDVNTEYLSDDIFNDGVADLSRGLSKLFNDKTEDEYYRVIQKARDNGERYVLLHRNVSYQQLQKVKQLPLLELGKFRGGIIISQTSKRDMPFKELAVRTIGYSRNNIKPIGIEGAYDQFLKGVNGHGIKEKIAGGIWISLNGGLKVPPQNGEDIITTINVNYQDVAETALRNQLIKHKADHGCAVLMEVKTGNVLAIANLGRVDSNDRYEENYNYAIGETTEPGSIFKLPSLLTAMEDGYVNLNDTVSLEHGKHKYYDRVMHDSHIEETQIVTVLKAFEISSNVGISKIIYRYYAKQPEKFVDGLCRLGLNKPLNLSLPGEGAPEIPNPREKHWDGTTLPWLAIGYNVLITPLQTLALYNGVANNGVMVKPQFIESIVKDGKTVKSFAPDIINPSICSEATLSRLRKLLEGVVQEGTASNLNNSVYQIAGKTGTAQIASGGKYKNGEKVNYSASFVGYFPANKPEYSCIVVVNSPGKDGYYGNVVAGTIFKEIADKVYANSLKINPSKTDSGVFKTGKEPLVKATDWKNALDNSFSPGNKLRLQSLLKEGVMPDLSGLDVEDALYLLGSYKLNVNISGYGAVSQQSISPGEKFSCGQTIKLKLS
jgi:cell division protein FtsI (penicillin-binding protein 3)